MKGDSGTPSPAGAVETGETRAFEMQRKRMASTRATFVLGGAILSCAKIECVSRLTPFLSDADQRRLEEAMRMLHRNSSEPAKDGSSCGSGLGSVGREAPSIDARSRVGIGGSPDRAESRETPEPKDSLAATPRVG